MKKSTSKGDLARIDRMKDSDIDYSDIPPLDNSFFKKPHSGMAAKEEHTITSLA